MSKLALLRYSLLCCNNHYKKHNIQIKTARKLFSLPDLSNFSPFPTSDRNSREPYTYHERKILPYCQRELYKVVSDVASYPHFLPFCTSTRILSKTIPENPNALGPAGTVRMEAEMTVGFMSVQESYASDVTCVPYESVQAVAASSTPLFEHLSTSWRFQPAPTRSPHPSDDTLSLSTVPVVENDPDERPTLVTLDLAYSFANPLHAAMSTAFFGQVSKMMVSAFEQRCLDLYGPGRR